MKNFIAFLLTLSILTCTTAMAADMEMGIGMGGLNIDSDITTKKTFSRDFFWSAYMGVRGNNNFSLRGNLGFYSNTSHHPDDIGTNFRLGITSLTASLIYHMTSKHDDIQPYLGGGAGAYFYDLKDDLIGEIETGTKFGFHLLGGAKIKITDAFYVVAEYNKHFVSPIFFNNAKEFNHSTLTLGASLFFPLKPHTPARKIYSSEPDPYSDYKFNKYEEDLLLEIVQLKTEIKEMESKRDEMQKKVDNFYRDHEYDEYDDDFEKKYRQVQFTENKIKIINKEIREAKNKLNELKRDWRSLRKDNQPIEKHIVYLERNYTYSPHGVYLIKGYYTRSNKPYRHRYYRRHRRKHKPKVHHYNNSSYKYKEENTEKLKEKEEFFEKKRDYIKKLKNRR